MAPRTPPRAPGALDRDAPPKSADAYRTIGEVAVELRLPQHVLRFWETRFTQIKPLKRAGGRRFYRPEDVALLRAVQTLLYDEGYTIKGVQRLLAELGARHVADAHARSRDRAPAPADRDAPAGPGRDRLEDFGTGDAGGGETPGRASAPPRSDERATVSRQPSSQGDWIEGLNVVLDELHECARLIAAVRAPEA